MRPIFLVLFVGLSVEMPAAAYTDPGSGALIWQALIGAVVGCSFYARKVVAYFTRKRTPEK